MASTATQNVGSNGRAQGKQPFMLEKLALEHEQHLNKLWIATLGGGLGTPPKTENPFRGGESGGYF